MEHTMASEQKPRFGEGSGRLANTGFPPKTSLCASSKGNLESGKSQQIPPHNQTKWARLAEYIEENPIHLGDYTEKYMNSIKEIRENFSFKNDELSI